MLSDGSLLYAALFAGGGLYVLLGCRNVAPGLRLIIGAAAIAVAVIAVRTAHQPWQWRWH